MDVTITYTLEAGHLRPELIDYMQACPHGSVRQHEERAAIYQIFTMRVADDADTSEVSRWARGATVGKFESVAFEGELEAVQIPVEDTGEGELPVDDGLTPEEETALEEAKEADDSEPESGETVELSGEDLAIGTGDDGGGDEEPVTGNAGVSNELADESASDPDAELPDPPVEAEEASNDEAPAEEPAEEKAA